MRYKEEKQDLFSVPDDYYLAHCISADFGMGKGIVIEFNKRFDMKRKLQRQYPNYIDKYISGKMGGDCILEGRVFNLITKERYFLKPSMNTMGIALKRMREICMEKGITKIAMPTIGAGLDRLNWEAVAALIRETFKETEIEILVCKVK